METAFGCVCGSSVHLTPPEGASCGPWLQGTPFPLADVLFSADTTIYRLGSFDVVCSSRFWRLVAWNQGASMAGLQTSPCVLTTFKG